MAPVYHLTQATPEQLSRAIEFLQSALLSSEQSWIVATGFAVPGWRPSPADSLPDFEALTGSTTVYALPQTAHFQDTLIVVVAHPQLDGFSIARLHAHRDIANLRLTVSESLRSAVSLHHRPVDNLFRGQHLPIDIELHPSTVHTPVSGSITASDGSTELCSMRITVATAPHAHFSMSGYVEGPICGAQLELVNHELITGVRSATQVAALIEAQETS